MKFLKVPEHRALAIAWAALAGWAGVAFYATGLDGWMPVFWPAVIVVVMTFRILKTKRARLEWEAKNPTFGAANISQKPTAVRASGK